MRYVLTAVLTAVLLFVAAPAPARAVTDDCATAATQGMIGTGLYTSDPALIARLVKNPEAQAYVFFRLKFATPTCSGAKYNVIAFDASTASRVGIDEAKGPGTFSTGLGVYVIEFQLPITSFDATTGTPSAVCVRDVVSINDTIVHAGPTTGQNGCTFPGLYLALNPGGGGGGEFDM